MTGQRCKEQRVDVWESWSGICYRSVCYTGASSRPRTLVTKHNRTHCIYQALVSQTGPLQCIILVGKWLCMLLSDSFRSLVENWQRYWSIIVDQNACLVKTEFSTCTCIYQGTSKDFSKLNWHVFPVSVCTCCRTLVVILFKKDWSDMFDISNSHFVLKTSVGFTISKNHYENPAAVLFSDKEA